MSSLPPYPYEALDPRKDEIRILRLLPGKTGDPISGTLERVSRHAKLRYDALSYVWGDVNPPQKLIINQAFSLDITPNLAQALDDLRHPYRTRTLWVDAICINQSDLDEKSRQVQAMATTFSEARCVRAYLSAKINPKDGAFKAVRKLAPLTYLPGQNDTSGLNPVHLHSHLGKLEFFILLCTLTRYHPEITVESGYSKGTHILCWLGLKKRFQDFDPDIWDASLAIIENPFWQRIWIQQEIVLARKLKLHCRRDIIDGKQWFSFEHSCRSRGDSTAISFPKHWSYSYRAARENHQLPRPINFSRGCLLDIFRKSGEFHTTDRRDRVYGLLGVARDHIAGQIEVNYLLSLAQVYMQVMQHHVRTWKTLEFLCVRRLPPLQKSFTMSPNVPTWLPCPEKSLELYFHGVRTSGSSGTVLTEHASFDADDLGLRLKGIMQGTCRLVEGPPFAMNTPIDRWWSSLLAICATIPGPGGEKPTIGFALDQLMELTRHEWEAEGPRGADLEILARVRASKELRVRDFCHRLLNSESAGKELRSKSLHDLQSRDRLEHYAKLAKFPLPDEQKIVPYELYCAAGARFFAVDSHRVGMVYIFDYQNDIQAGDELWVLFGCRRPVVLRPVPGQSSEYTVIGSAIVPTLMNGQAVEGIDYLGNPTPNYKGNPVVSLVLR